MSEQENKKGALDDTFLNVTAERDEIKQKESEIYKHSVETRHENMLRQKDEKEKVASIDLTTNNIERIKRLQKENREYLEMAKKSKVFINDDFAGVVPYFPRNIILIAGTTGDGKSTTSANLTFHALKQNQRALVITNEEAPTDVYNRITCLIHGWAYNNHKDFTKDQIDAFDKYIGVLSKRLTVIDDSYGNNMGQTTTIEGIEGIFKNLIDKNIIYDVVIIDYYQNIDRSIAASSLKDWEVQARFAKFIDKMKNIYPAPIIVLAQKKPNNEKVSFKESMEGRKSIMNVATCAIDMQAERDHLRTSWTIVKSRFPNSVGDTIMTGFKRGKYVPYDSNFIGEVEMLKMQKEKAKMLGNIAVTNRNTEENEGNE